MSNATLLARLAALKATSGSGKKEENKDEKKADAVVVEKAKELITATNEKVVVSAPTTVPSSTNTLNVEKIKLIVENVATLDLVIDAKNIEGFNHIAFEDNLKKINLLQDQSFAEINTALSVINKDLRKFPELAHLLSDEQVRVIVQRILHEKHAFIAPVREVKEKKEKKAKEADAFESFKNSLLSASGEEDGLSANDL